MLLKIFAKILTVILFLSVIAGILFFIIYPKYPEIKNEINQLEVYRLSHNTTLSLFTRILPPNQDIFIEDVSQEGSMEHLSQDDLIRLKNEGKILFNMEKQKTSIYIPSVDIRGAVVDDETPFGMERGFWHFPLSGEVGKQGNTVIIAHRFKYLPPRTDTFFNLDRVKVGDKIIVNQKDGSYRYTVLETKVVEKNDRNVLLQTKDYRITLITCTPLWTADQRLVVVGKLDKVYGSI